jgi:hypothetical protein
VHQQQQHQQRQQQPSNDTCPTNECNTTNNNETKIHGRYQLVHLMANSDSERTILIIFEDERKGKVIEN